MKDFIIYYQYKHDASASGAPVRSIQIAAHSREEAVFLFHQRYSSGNYRILLPEEEIKSIQIPCRNRWLCAEIDEKNNEQIRIYVKRADQTVLPLVSVNAPMTDFDFDHPTNSIYMEVFHDPMKQQGIEQYGFTEEALNA